MGLYSACSFLCHSLGLRAISISQLSGGIQPCVTDWISQNEPVFSEPFPLVPWPVLATGGLVVLTLPQLGLRFVALQTLHFYHFRTNLCSQVYSVRGVRPQPAACTPVHTHNPVCANRRVHAIPCVFILGKMEGF